MLIPVPSLDVQAKAEQRANELNVKAATQRASAQKRWVDAKTAFAAALTDEDLDA